MRRPEAMGMQCWDEHQDRHCQRGDLPDYGKDGAAHAHAFSNGQNQNGHDDGGDRNKPNVLRDPGIHGGSLIFFLLFLFQTWNPLNRFMIDLRKLQPLDEPRDPFLARFRIQCVTGFIERDLLRLRE